MLDGMTVFATAFGYVSALFLIAYWGDHAGRSFMAGRARGPIYALSLAVYCTTWTYYGSVGIASAHGLDFLPIYIGPIIVVGFGHRLVARIATIAKAQNITSVADFVAARYGKAQHVAALVALSSRVYRSGASDRQCDTVAFAPRTNPACDHLRAIPCPSNGDRPFYRRSRWSLRS